MQQQQFQHTPGNSIPVTFTDDRNHIAAARPIHWFDANPRHFTGADRAGTTILIGGLTVFQDELLEAGLETGGCKIRALPCPDNQAFQLGKEYGNRGQCNPTYFTVGNLVKYLQQLHEVEGMSKEEIVKRYVFLTAGTCGPCRFGMYTTEYRKALRDAGFENFRVLSFEAGEGIKDVNGEGPTLAITPKFVLSLLRCLISGDVLNLLGYRIRPYEIEAGMTDRVLTECRDILAHAMRNKKNMLLALYKCRRKLQAIKVNRLQVKPKVAIIGEFWAMTTEGDGNYHLQRYLEAEGAEVDIQPIMNTVLYLLWFVDFQFRQFLLLPDQNNVKEGLDFTPMKKHFLLWLTRTAMNGWFALYSRILGLRDYHLSDVAELARLSREYHSSEVTGGEGPMEIGKLISYVKKNKAHLVISVKPFGCLPSSGVSDGIQSLVTSRYPEANFLPIETSGDGAVNVYSRVQMALFRARKQAQAEFAAALADKGMDATDVAQQMEAKWSNALHTPPHRQACTAANLVNQL
ncbi:MAG: 2-hydroxyglutaryl-CoA dehydratase [Gammaproteobacteria bacterium]|nr:2-hydroxyglutaryl-CoA dehydratase [Gammaproteobacteria bacterium]MDH5650244.1 2-hydroxyglutaryl-CoA dehydratase [Gammaproteobacteria bacterium]